MSSGAERTEQPLQRPSFADAPLDADERERLRALRAASSENSPLYVAILTALSEAAKLMRWRRRLDRDGIPCSPDDWMSCNTTGRFLNPESISQLFDRIVQRNGLPRIRFHDLRHTHASLLVADGTTINVVAERLGHAHPAFMMHTYQHLLPGTSGAAAERFAELVANASR